MIFAPGSISAAMPRYSSLPGILSTTRLLPSASACSSVRYFLRRLIQGRRGERRDARRRAIRVAAEPGERANERGALARAMHVTMCGEYLLAQAGAGARHADDKYRRRIVILRPWPLRKRAASNAAILARMNPAKASRENGWLSRNNLVDLRVRGFDVDGVSFKKSVIYASNSIPSAAAISNEREGN